MSTELTDNLPKWFSNRPKWLQTAAAKLFNQAELSDEDISNLAQLCLQEAENPYSVTSCSFPDTAFSQGSIDSLRLCSISDVKGINALSPRKPLEFGKGNLTVVYGNNGSGKSGYVRLLKHVCGARNPGVLHQNVFKTDLDEQEATIYYEQNNTLEHYNWGGEGVCEDLRSTDIFDASFGRVFVSSEDEVSYEPPILSFFSSLIEVCEKVASALNSEATRQLSKKPNMPADLKVTAECSWYENISAKTPPQDIEKHCTFDDKEEAEIKTFQQRLAELAPAEKAKQLKRQKHHIDALVQDAQKHLEQLSDENCRRIVAAKKKLILKKKAADAAAKKVFSDSLLEEIGSDVWKELWEAARNYSVSVAYKESEYPNISEGARCVLCHQSLSQEAKDRLVSFEEFVKGEMQHVAEEAAKEYEVAIQTIENIPTQDSSLKARIDATGIQGDEFTRQVTASFTQLKARKDQLLEINSDELLLPSLQSPKWIEKAKTQSKEVAELAVRYEEDAKNDNRDEIKKRLNSLLAKKWLSENRAAIEEEVSRLKILTRIQKAKKTTNTKALSQKKGELAEELITDAFLKRFNTELRALGASQINVELVKSKVSKGRVLHKLQLRGASESALPDVLSEGESRIVSIAAFLADVTGKSSKAPFIFDDPISSLDQSYEEAVVKRLIELSHDKQVIVFTHRLSLLGTLKHFAEKKSIKPDVVSIRSTDWGTGEPAPIPMSQSDIKSALNTLIHQRYRETKKAYDDGDFIHAEILLKSICSDFRTLVERSIENDLLCGIVQRFQRPIHTLKIKDLAKLKESDCNLLDSLMTKYSGFEHSQPEESPVDLPKPEDLLRDMQSLKEWREEYAKRK